MEAMQWKRNQELRILKCDILGKLNLTTEMLDLTLIDDKK